MNSPVNTQNQKRFSIRKWTKATFLGWLLGVFIILGLSSLLDATGIEHMQFYLGVGMGAGVGFMQWILLKKYFAINTDWVWASVLGMGIPFVLLDLILKETFAYKLPLGVALGGISAGLLQSLILKKYFQKASLWVVGCFIGCGLQQF